ncbi:xanthine dehydrogenase family protein molybdopterin-binding subunit [Haliangium ochraceum]|uniref:Aldehyde oxidase and xanthine dehydrogenase molybdopterin binding protein n=1 Tax=Haliangium ochraceum (strain DSM 14365 / JCM 11303 / SMP-2) TaxID=502025 RepID=D0LHQ3_HALO1|nr:xanthine dehydrogenase family protein molybdopterin-binding subunit [Haliangium ochraceum]ACY12915.1 aldehyde oxidase and xanthine dehydrogenase molybdopterin binding protein [Haliangium ochraceum DSM 14365]
MSHRYADEVFAQLYPHMAHGAGPSESFESAPAPAGGGLSRRSFLRIGGAAGGGLLIAVSLGACKDKPATTGEQPSEQPSEDPSGPFEANAFVTIEPEGTAKITVAKSEMGQGVRTTLAMIVAEELDLDWARVRVEQAPGDGETYGKQGTGGSGSVRDGWIPLREAGAKARAMLVAAAAKKFGVDAGELSTSASTVRHEASGRSLGYGELAGLAAQESVPDSVTFKSASEYTLLGKEHPGIDVLDIVQGKAVYGMDLRKPDMLYASIERSPIFGGTVKSVDSEAAMAVPGVVKVVEIPAQGGDIKVASGVAVIAKNTWAAMKGREQLAVEWNPGEHAEESSDGYLGQMRKSIAKQGEFEVNKLGDPEAQISAGAVALRARYEVPFIAHATMEPMNCTALVDGERCQLWGPMQFPNWARGAAAKVLGIPVEKVSAEITLLGGGFGRRINPDVAVEAALVAKEVEGPVPVQVLWSREDDMQHDFYRPIAVHEIEASLDAEGAPLAWRHRMSTPAIRATIAAEAEIEDLAVGESNGASDMLYRIPNRSLEYTHQPSGVHRGWWRAVHTTHTTFAVESFLDELAEKAGKDPYEYRMGLIDELTVSRPQPNKDFPWDPARLRGVLELAAKKAEWGKELPPGHGVGLAVGIDHLSYGAEVVEVSVIDGKLRIHKVVCAADCGPVLNPNGARAQLEGGIVQGLSAALKEKITITGGRVDQGNFDSYPILRIDEAPLVIESYFVETDTHPTGLGEPSVPPIAAALANAIYRATGKRLRTLPLQLA